MGGPRCRNEATRGGCVMTVLFFFFTRSSARDSSSSLPKDKNNVSSLALPNSPVGMPVLQASFHLMSFQTSQTLDGLSCVTSFVLPLGCNRSPFATNIQNFKVYKDNKHTACNMLRFSCNASPRHPPLPVFMIRDRLILCFTVSIKCIIFDACRYHAVPVQKYTDMYLSYHQQKSSANANSILPYYIVRNNQQPTTNMCMMPDVLPIVY